MKYRRNWTYLYHVTNEKGRNGLLKDQRFFDDRSCGWETEGEAQDWAEMEVKEKGVPAYIMCVCVDKYKHDKKFSYAVIENKDIIFIEVLRKVS